jgi:hypothetical protein
MQELRETSKLEDAIILWVELIGFRGSCQFGQVPLMV